jgi:(2Fe-2S) ferredoxin
MAHLYYQKHIFFCINQRDSGRQCCANHNAKALHEYAKKRLKSIDLSIIGDIRVNQSGCLGRCKEGPVLVIYPEGTWYTYANEQDIDEIIDQHILKQQPVKRLLLPQNPPR